MELIVGTEDLDIGSPFPETPFVARQYNIASGPLCIVSLTSGINPPSYNVMFLEGTGGPARGDVWTGVTFERLAKEFIPLRQALTFKNRWR